MLDYSSSLSHEEKTIEAYMLFAMRYAPCALRYAKSEAGSFGPGLLTETGNTTEGLGGSMEMTRKTRVALAVCILLIITAGPVFAASGSVSDEFSSSSGWAMTGGGFTINGGYLNWQTSASFESHGTGGNQRR
jgi:hypothetical protein